MVKNKAVSGNQIWNRRRWKPEEIKLATQLIEEKKTYKEIAEALNVNENSLRRTLNRNGYYATSVYGEFIICSECSVEFSRRDRDKYGKLRHRFKFCSQSCSVSHSNKRRERKNRNTRICLNCNQGYDGGGLTYCSNKCQFEQRNKLLIERVKTNNTKGLSNWLIKKALILIYGDKCMKCEWNEINEKTGNVPIELNHKDGNSGNTDATNVELLCPNCHSLTPNYKALNNGNGRYKRRERARQGKSY